VRVHLPGKHALEFQLLDAPREPLDVLDDRIGRVLVVLHFREVQQFAGACQALAEAADAVDRLVQQRALAAQGLRAFGVVPDVGVLQLAVDLFQALDLGVVVKETPVATAAGR
jgi:hypothetical protein